jgi:Tfp pilus assembly protein FimT
MLVNDTAPKTLMLVAVVCAIIGIIAYTGFSQWLHWPL